MHVVPARHVHGCRARYGVLYLRGRLVLADGGDRVRPVRGGLVLRCWHSNNMLCGLVLGAVCIGLQPLLCGHVLGGQCLRMWGVRGRHLRAGGLRDVRPLRGGLVLRGGRPDDLRGGLVLGRGRGQLQPLLCGHL